jgi:hypothetical protein
MSGESRPGGSVLSSLKRPLLTNQPQSVPTVLEEKLLGPEHGREVTIPEPSRNILERSGKVPTVPVTFHLPIAMRDRLKLTAQAKGLTQLEIAKTALQEYLDKHPVSEQDLRRLLNL